MNSGCIDFKENKISLICRIRRWLYVSPSAIISHCTQGIRHHTQHCKTCEYYVPKIIHDGLIAGMNSVKKSIIDQIKEHEEKGDNNG